AAVAFLASGEWGSVLSGAMKLIVAAYVSLKNRTALEDMREHRQRLKRELLTKQTDAFDFSNSIRAFDDEVVVIETGLQRLGGAAPHRSIWGHFSPPDADRAAGMRLLVIARSQRVRPAWAGPMTGSARKQSTSQQAEEWIASLRSQ